MIKGALVLASGLAIGYAKGIQENGAVFDKIEEKVKRLGDYLEEAMNSDVPENTKQIVADAVKASEGAPDDKIIWAYVNSDDPTDTNEFTVGDLRALGQHFNRTANEETPKENPTQ